MIAVAKTGARMAADLLARFEDADIILVTFRSSSCSECSENRLSVRFVRVSVVIAQLLPVYPSFYCFFFFLVTVMALAVGTFHG